MTRGLVIVPLAAGLLLGHAALAAEDREAPRIVLEEAPTAAAAGLPAEQAGQGKDASAPSADPFQGARRVRLAPYRIEVAAKERLSAALGRFLEKERWRLAWESTGDFVIAHGFAVEAKELKDALERVLSAYGLSATIYEGNRVVAVRAATVTP